MLDIIESFRVNLRQSLIDYWQVILIYPALFLYVFSNDINLISQHGLIYRKICLHEYNESICNSIHSNPNASNRVQELTSQAQIVLNVAFIVPAILAIIHLSSIADRRLNYELPLVVSLLGSIAQAFICIFAVDADFELSFYLLVGSQLVNGVLGAGSLSFISSCFSHVANYENRRSTIDTIGARPRSAHRSIRYSFCEACLLLGQFIGSLSSGHLIGNKINLDNFQRVYIISFAVYLFVLVYVVVIFRYLKWRQSRDDTPDSGLLSLNTSDYLDGDKSDELEPPKVEVSTSGLTFIKKQFRFVSETWQLLTRRRPNNARFLILALLFMFFLGCSISMGIMSLQYLYLIKKPIKMSQVNYGYFKAFNTFCRALALLVILPVLKRCFNVPDYVLFILGFTSEFLNLVVFSTAYFFKYIIWIGPITYMFSNYFVVCIRSYSSKLVDKHETGKYFGLIGVTEFLVLLTSSSLFSMIYRYTVAFFPPFVFFLGCMISVLICYPFLIYVIRDLKRNQLSDSDNN